MITEDDREALEALKEEAGEDGLVIPSAIPDDQVSSVNLAHLEQAGALKRKVINKQTYFEIMPLDDAKEEE